MARHVRQCTQCRAIDDRSEWSSPEQAADDGAFNDPWTCATCAWTEFDLVEATGNTTTGDVSDDIQDVERARVAATEHDPAPGRDPTMRTPA